MSQIRSLKEEIHRRGRGDKIDRSAVEQAKGDVERALQRLSDIISTSNKSPPRRHIQQTTPDSVVSPPPQPSHLTHSTQAFYSIPPPSAPTPRQSKCCPPKHPESTSQINTVPVEPHNAMSHPISIMPTNMPSTIMYPSPAHNQLQIAYPYGPGIPNMLPVQLQQNGQTPQTIDEAALPSYRSAYPESKEREECCLGLISCDPDPMPEG